MARSGSRPRPSRRKTFGEELQRARIRAGFSRSQLAEISGVSQTTIRNAEKLVSVPHAYIVSRLATALEIDVDRFLSLAGRKAS